MFVFGANKKKKFLMFLFIFSVVGGGVFLVFDTKTAHALPFSSTVDRGDCAFGEGFVDCWNSGGEKSNRSSNPIEVGFKWLLYGIFTFFGWLASVALTLFEWAIDPKYISGDPGLFNRESIYNMWKFIRDFFNLFFILVLLYIAFTVVFQIQKDFKKALLSLVLAALFINFSFPVTRFLIDATNVPMYFFANQMLAANGKGNILGPAMSASSLKGILVPGSQDGKFDTDRVTVSRLIAAIVFIFLFSITLLVLAVMFVIRLIALLILLVFSAAGFAASIIPGMKEYSDMWWKNFWKYALFGPAAMLMILIATRFFDEIGNEQSAVLVGLRNTATGVTTQTETSFIASMAMFSIPIIMLWMAMGLAQKMSIAGASSVVGAGQKFSKWAGKKTMDGGKWLTYKNPVARGVGGGVKDRFDNNRLVKFLRSPSKTEARIKGAVGTGTMKGELEKLHDKAAYEKAKKMKEDNVGNSELEKSLGSSNRKADGSFKDLVAARAAAMVLSERKAISSANDFSAALQALGNNTKEVSALINGAGRPAFATMDGAMYRNIVNSNVISSNPNIAKAFDAQLKKEGKADAIVDYRVSINGEPQGAVIRDVFDNMTADVIAKQEDLFKHVRYGSDAKIDIGSLMGTDPQLYQEVKRKASKKVSALIP